MTDVIQQRRPARDAEAAAIAAVVERLVERFPGRTRDDVAQCVQDRYDSFAGSRIRDFLPVLVERAAGRELTASAARG